MRHRRKNIVLIIAFASITMSATTEEKEPQIRPVGFVVELSGTWFLGKEENRVEVGQVLPERSTLAVGDSSDPASRIAVALYDGDIFVVSCNIIGACVAPSDLPARRTAPSIGKRFLDVLQKILLTRQEEYATVMSRGLSLHDSVASLEGGRTLTGLPTPPPGEYSFQLVPIREDGTVVPGEIPISVPYNGEPVVVLPSELGPGLYELTLSGRNRKLSAWLVLAPPRQYEDLSENFAEARIVVGTWEEALRPNGAQRLLRLYLSHLVLLVDEDEDSEVE